MQTLYAEVPTGKANQTINLIFQKILFSGNRPLFKMNLSKKRSKYKQVFWFMIILEVKQSLIRMLKFSRLEIRNLGPHRYNKAIGLLNYPDNASYLN